MTEIIVDDNNPVYASDTKALYNKDLSTLIACPATRNGSFDIPSSVSTIALLAFASNHSLKEIAIPSSVTTIGGAAFRDTKLETISIPNSVQEIEDDAFSFCVNLKTADIDVSEIAQWLFAGCTNLSSVHLGASVSLIVGDAFMNCNSITSVYCQSQIPPEVELSSMLFEDEVYANATLYIPTGCKSIYS